MVSSPNAQSTVSLNTGVNKTSTAISTNIIILVNNIPVGAVQSLAIHEKRSVKMIDEVGTDGHIDSVPNQSTEISGTCQRIRFDKLRIAEAFSRGFIHVASQVYPFDIVILDKQKRDRGSQISTVIKNVWIEGIEYTYTVQDWVISETMQWKAETIFSILNGGSRPGASGSSSASVAVGGERAIQHATFAMGDGGSIANIEQVTDTGGRRGSLDAAGLIDLDMGNPSSY